MNRFAKFIPQKIRNQLAQNDLVQTYRRQKYAKVLRSMNQPTPWTIGHVEITDDTIEIRGWAIAPEGNHGRVGFLINDVTFDEIEYPRPRADIENIFWYYPGSNLSNFICRSKLRETAWVSEEHATLKYIDLKTQKPLREDHNFYYPAKRLIKNLPMPDAARRTRVHGGDSESSFLIEGFTTYKKLQQVLKTKFNKDYDDFSNILDWGCGCGRMTRYFKALKKAGVTGVDIDADNIHWNQQNLDFGSYTAIPPHPPTGLPESTYDLLIGISIFTHLGEKDQFEWLAELARIAADGAILLMTVHGDTTVCRSNLPYNLFNTLRAQGFLDVGPNPNLAGVLEEEDYYRNTYHTRSYIEKNWLTYFEIIDILPGLIGNHQDLVILRK
jgi:2-polyprenyl-3-methyl-5-hydroxy-6-metoxy-1,4-benzoquinol methylase